ncbi:hypothetical protein A3A70_01880 [candidate division WWE3 bacterium RIFCSPLOWO2_01_FULL_42_11]|uniref:RNase H type-1 domain-containing protein n=1 Tax=candidate division WWE3 bacterium RIFCSPLOWO2_01_FULL_42_11 TaxID=1802627 RepID=A0A1F4VQX5_UNCKA|nr:MAG: hypothetical protein A3A70_01880 [candidate division WWE3 bacterium RIFCSPLOWO2_01_FULL_42_11]
MYELFTDGGARGNPGPTAIGMVLKSNGQTIIAHSEFIGSKTNNEAEYLALIAGLNLAIKHKVTTLQCFLDSKLVVEQINGRFKVKEPRMREMVTKVQDLITKIGKVEVTYVPREQNGEADGLVNVELEKNGFPKSEFKFFKS